MASEADIVGFNPRDADALLALIGGVGGTSIPRSRIPLSSCMLGKTKSGGLASGAEGSVWLMDVTGIGWEVSTTDSCPAWTVGATIPADSLVLLVPVNGRWLALRIC
jgi:hypothetical protein